MPNTLIPEYLVEMAPRRIAMLFGLALLVCGCSLNTAPRDLRALERSSSPNDALACPRATCATKIDIDSPTLALAPERLEKIVRKVISGQARTELVGEAPEIRQVVFVQRSKIFGFADTIWIQTVDLASRASLIIYSKSNFGFWDLGVNRRRVISWLSEIESAAQSASNHPADSRTSAGAKPTP